MPDDFAVVGFDDIPFATYVSPSLTTVAQPKFELGQQAMSMALTLIAGLAEGVGDVVLQGRLVVRESTGVGNSRSGTGDSEVTLLESECRVPSSGVQSPKKELT